MNYPSIIKPPDRDLGSRWPVLNGTPMLFVGQTQIPADNEHDLPPAELYIFAGRGTVPPDLVPPHLRGENDWVAEYEVLLHDVSRDAWTAHHLIQDKGVVYHVAGTTAERASVDMLAQSAFRVMQRKPRWRASEATWPMLNGRHMVFIAQWVVPENQLTKGTFAGEAIFLFADRAGGALEIKIWTTDVRVQTAEDHYRAEELMALFDRHPADPQTLERCIREGDPYVHEFMLGHKRATREAITLLAKSARTKKLRDAAAKKLRGEKA